MFEIYHINHINCCKIWALKNMPHHNTHWCTSRRISDTTIFIFNDKPGDCTSHSIRVELEILHVSRCHRGSWQPLSETMVWPYPSQISLTPSLNSPIGVPRSIITWPHGPQLPWGRQFLFPPTCHLQSLRRRTWMSPSNVDWAYQTFHPVESDIVTYRGTVNQRKLRKAWQNYLLNHLFSWWWMIRHTV